jgi:hypothetical protein
MSASQAHVILARAEIKAHLSEYWIMSDFSKPEFEERCGGVCGLYVDPPANVLVVSLDEKTGSRPRRMARPRRGRHGCPWCRPHRLQAWSVNTVSSAILSCAAAAAAGVAPGGTLLVVAHDRENLDHGHGGPQDPAVLYTAEDIIGDLAGSGLHIDRADRVRRPVQTPDGERVALDALLRASRA